MKRLRRIVLLLVVAALGVGIWYFCKKPQSKEEYLKDLTPQQALAFLEEMDVELPESYQEWDPDTLGQEAKRVIAACVEEPYNPYVFSTEDPYRFYIAIYKAVQKYLKQEYLKDLTPQQALEFLEEMDVELPESYQEWDPDTLGQEAKRVIAEIVENPVYLLIFSSSETSTYQFGEAVKNAVDAYLETE